MTALDTTNPIPAAPSRILVAEDDTNVRDFCMRLLRMNGYQAAPAENGRVALERLNESHYDLVLTDLQMPEMGGIELLHELRQYHPGVDSIVMTAHATVETAREALKLGAFDYLPKPVKREMLVAALEKWVPQPTVLAMPAEKLMALLT